MREGTVTGGEGEPLSLRERFVLDALRPTPVLLAAYRRILDLARPIGQDDGLSTMLAGHLTRELMNYLDYLGSGSEDGGKVEYESEFDGISKAWKKEKRGGTDIPPAVRKAVLRLLNSHEASKSRKPPIADMMAEMDPARAGFSNPGGLDRWDEVHRLAVSLTHLPRRTEAGRSRAQAEHLALSLTDALYGFYAPAPLTENAIDEVLAEGPPDEGRLARLCALASRPAAADHFFRAVSPEWLPTMVAGKRSRKHFFEPPPPSPNVRMRISPWPCGDFLVRAAPRYPEEAASEVWCGRTNAHPWVVRCVIEVLLAVPTEVASAQLRRDPAWPRPDQRLEPFGDRYVELALRLVESGEEDAGERLAANTLLALCPEPEGAARWASGADLELSEALSLLTAAFDTPERRPRLAGMLLGLVEPALRKAAAGGRDSRYWLRRLGDRDEHPDAGVPSRVFHAVYEAARYASDADLADAVGRLTGARKPEALRRLGLALLARRPEVRPDLVGRILGRPESWYPGACRREFRDLVAAGFELLEPGPRAALLAFASAAAEADQIRARNEAAGYPMPPAETMRARWQSELLGRAAGSLTEAERSSMASGFPVEVPPEQPFVAVPREQPVSPLSAAELAEAGPAGLAALAAGDQVDDWPLGAVIRTTVAARGAEWAAGVGYLDGLPARLGYHVVLGFQDALKSRAEADWPAVLDWIRRRVVADPTGARDMALASCWLLRDGLVGEDPTLPPNAHGSAIALATELLDSPDPAAPDGDHGPADPITAGLNCVRGCAVEAASWLLYRVRVGPEREALEGHLLATLSREASSAVWSSVGRGLPPLLDGGLSEPEAWAESVLGEAADADRRRLVWSGYVSTWIPIGAVTKAAPYAYGAAAREGWGGPSGGLLSPRDRLGQHIVRIALGGWHPDADSWLESFYETADAEGRAKASSFVADHLAPEDQPEAVVGRAVGWLRRRLEVADAAELRAIGWAARTASRQREVFETIVLPAITRCGRTDNVYGAMEGMAAVASEVPEATAAALKELIAADDLGSIVDTQGDEIEAILRSLLASGCTPAVDAARRIRDELAGRGLDRFRTLTDPG